MHRPFSHLSHLPQFPDSVPADDGVHGLQEQIGNGGQRGPFLREVHPGAGHLHCLFVRAEQHV